jgi:hypothetical protein
MWGQQSYFSAEYGTQQPTCCHPLSEDVASPSADLRRYCRVPPLTGIIDTALGEQRGSNTGAGVGAPTPALASAPAPSGAVDWNGARAARLQMVNLTRWESLPPDAGTAQDCPVCLHEVNPRNAVITPCGHLCDRSCVVEWLLLNDGCPTCRARIVQRPAHDATTAAARRAPAPALAPGYGRPAQ